MGIKEEKILDFSPIGSVQPQRRMQQQTLEQGVCFQARLEIGGGSRYRPIR